MLHLHSLIYRRVMRDHKRTTLAVVMMVSAPSLAACAFPRQSLALYALFALSAIGYGLMYRRMVSFRWCFSPF
ncbi:MAG: hypothetical protein EBS54_00785 [Betaproteobacteria bacterium]|nr:hypothetical protein [Betaproteobacteria bacterium]